MSDQDRDVVSLRRRIIDASRFLFQTKGFDNTTVRDLIERLQISEQLFFCYFQSMDEILEVVWSES